MMHIDLKDLMEDTIFAKSINPVKMKHLLVFDRITTDGNSYNVLGSCHFKAMLIFVFPNPYMTCDMKISSNHYTDP